ncbi:MAG: hypothetical protein ABDI07_11365 [Candidatus Kryptonium sp.]
MVGTSFDGRVFRFRSAGLEFEVTVDGRSRLIRLDKKKEKEIEDVVGIAEDVHDFIDAVLKRGFEVVETKIYKQVGGEVYLASGEFDVIAKPDGYVSMHLKKGYSLEFNVWRFSTSIEFETTDVFKKYIESGDYRDVGVEFVVGYGIAVPADMLRFESRGSKLIAMVKGGDIFAEFTPSKSKLYYIAGSGITKGAEPIYEWFYDVIDENLGRMKVEKVNEYIYAFSFEPFSVLYSVGSGFNSIRYSGDIGIVAHRDVIKIRKEGQVAVDVLVFEEDKDVIEMVDDLLKTVF